MNNHLIHFDQIVAGIFEGAFDAACWDATMGRINALYGLEFCMVGIADLRQSQIASSTFYGASRSGFAEGIAEYQSERHLLDPTVAFTRNHPERQIVDSALDFDSADAAVRDHIAWNRHALGSARWIVWYAPPEDGFTIGFAAHFGKVDVDFERASREQMHRLFQHMMRAQQLAARPPLLAYEGEAIAFVDAFGRIKRMSASMESLLRAGVGITCRHDQFLIADLVAENQFRRLCREAALAIDSGSIGGTVRARRTNGLADLLIIVRPLPRPNTPFGFNSPVAEVRITNLAEKQPVTNAETWRRRFGLTAAEARVANQLIKGQGGMREVAEVLGISYATARVHLSRIFDKTGVHSQTRLVQLLTLGSY